MRQGLVLEQPVPELAESVQPPPVRIGLVEVSVRAQVQLAQEQARVPRLRKTRFPSARHRASAYRLRHSKSLSLSQQLAGDNHCRLVSF